MCSAILHLIGWHSETAHPSPPSQASRSTTLISSNAFYCHSFACLCSQTDRCLYVCMYVLQATGSVIAAQDIVDDAIDEPMPDTLRFVPSTRPKQVFSSLHPLPCSHLLVMILLPYYYSHADCTRPLQPPRPPRLRPVHPRPPQPQPNLPLPPQPNPLLLPQPSLRLLNLRPPRLCLWFITHQASAQGCMLPLQASAEAQPVYESIDDRKPGTRPRTYLDQRFTTHGSHMHTTCQ